MSPDVSWDSICSPELGASVPMTVFPSLNSQGGWDSPRQAREGASARACRGSYSTKQKGDLRCGHTAGAQLMSTSGVVDCPPRHPAQGPNCPPLQ